MGHTLKAYELMPAQSWANTLQIKEQQADAGMGKQWTKTC